MTTNDFWNLAGRSGRYVPGEPRIFGGIEFSRSNKNVVWFNKNREKLIRRQGIDKTILVENDKLKWFTNQSLKCSKDNPSEKNVYLLDPRINPAISIKIYKEKELAFKFMERIISFINRDPSTNETEWPDKDPALELVDPIFKYYKDSIPKGGWNFFNLKEGNRHKITSLRMFIKWFKEFDENSITRSYSWFWFHKMNQSNSSSKFEEFISLFKNRTKYEIMLILNHVFLINKELGYINFDLYDLLNFKTKNLELISYIKKNNLSDIFFRYKEESKKSNSKYFNQSDNLELFKDFISAIGKS